MAELTGKDEIREVVRERYAAAASSVGEGLVACCGTSESAGGGCGCGTDVPDACGGETFGAGLYEIAEQDALPGAAKLASLGCGNPTAVAELNEGETVLDLGSGGGIGVALSSRRSSPPPASRASRFARHTGSMTRRGRRSSAPGWTDRPRKRLNRCGAWSGFPASIRLMLCGAIDIGSNTTRLLVAEPEEGQLR